MTSNDKQQYLTVEVVRSELGELRTEIHSGFNNVNSEFKSIRAEIQAVRDVALVNSAKIDAYKDFTSIWFTVIAIFVALVGFIGTLAPMFREMYKDHRDAKKRSDLQMVAREVVRQEMDSVITQAIDRALSTLNSGGKTTM